MKTSILEQVEEAYKDEVKLEFRHSKNLREAIIKVLESKMDANRRSQISKANYDSPSWALTQADAIGYQRAMKELTELLK